MKTNLIIAAVIILLKVSKITGKEKFDCPVECPTNDYQPVCSRGKSYRNLCILQQEICKGTTAREIYDDVEDCPGYKKEDDASGKSVEAVDRNGVIFRRFIHSTKKELSKKASQISSTSTVRTIKKSYHSKKARKNERSKQSSSLPLFMQGYNFFQQCPPHFRICQGLIPAVPIFFFGNILSPCSGKKEKNRLFDDSGLFGNISRRSKKRVKRIDLIADSKFCQITCNPNEYRPVCSGKRAFRSQCYLKKAFCSGLVGKDVLKTAKKCPKIQHKRKRNKN